MISQSSRIAKPEDVDSGHSDGRPMKIKGDELKLLLMKIEDAEILETAWPKQKWGLT